MNRNCKRKRNSNQNEQTSDSEADQRYPLDNTDNIAESPALQGRPKRIKSTDVDNRRINELQNSPIPRFNLGSSVFAEIKQTDHFVDKTNFIQVILDDSPYVLITAPRRFGKSVLMDMLKEFVEKKVYTTGINIGKDMSRTLKNALAFPDKNLHVFRDKNLHIFTWRKFVRHHGKYPTIYVDFQSVGGDSFLEILFTFRDAIAKAFEEHKYLLKQEELWNTAKVDDRFEKAEFKKYLRQEPTNAEILGRITSNSNPRTVKKEMETILAKDIQKSLVFLASVLYQQFRHGVYLLIDEYDAPISNSIFKNKDNCQRVNRLLTDLFKGLLKNKTSHIQRALLTGVSSFGTVCLSEVNNVKKHMFLRGKEGGDNRYAVFYGITSEELKILLNHFVGNFWQGRSLFTEEELKTYYNGYKTIGQIEIKIFPIWSIICALENRQIDNYSETSEIMDQAKEALKIPIVTFAVEKLRQRETLQCKISHKLKLRHLHQLSDMILKSDDMRMKLTNADVYISFLIEQGYLTYSSQLPDDDMFEIAVPNDVARIELEKLIIDHFGKDYDNFLQVAADVLNKFSCSLKRVTGNNMKKLAESLEVALSCVHMKMEQVNENTYHDVIVHLLCKTRFTNWIQISRNTGRPNIAFYSEKCALIVNVKYGKSAKDAFDQIVEKDYVKMLSRKLPNPDINILIVGVNIDKDNKVSIAYKIAGRRGQPHIVN